MFVARKNLPSYKNRYAKSHNGLPFGTAPTHKAVGRVFFCGLPSANCGLRTAVCELRSAKSPSLPIVVLTIVILVIVVLAVVIRVIPIPVIIAFGPFLFFVPFVEFVQDKSCADG